MALLLPEDWGFNDVGNLAVLARGVRDAGDADESDWVEWKSTLDLNEKADCFLIARTILGMANRDPRTLRRSGHGYLLVGVEPGAGRGVEPVDLADLRPRVDAYTGGSTGPTWHPEYVSLDGSEIFVVVIDPPRMGDRIWTLRRESPPLGKKGTVPDGTVFYRRHGATERARAAEMDRLQTRLLGANHIPDDLGVTVEGRIPWVRGEMISDGVKVWVEGKREARLKARSQTIPVRRSDKSGIDLAAADFLSEAVGGLAAASRDSRSLAEYREEIDEWAEMLEEWAWETVCRHAARLCGQVIRLHNGGNSYLPKIEFELEVGGLSGPAWDSKPEDVDPPSPPKPFGSLTLGPGVTFPDISHLLVTPDSGTLGTYVQSDPLKVFDHGTDLAATRSATTDRVYLLLLFEPPEGTTASWSAACQGKDGILSGSVPIDFVEVQIDVAYLLNSIVPF